MPILTEDVKDLNNLKEGFVDFAGCTKTVTIKRGIEKSEAGMLITCNNMMDSEEDMRCRRRVECVLFTGCSIQNQQGEGINPFAAHRKREKILKSGLLSTLIGRIVSYSVDTEKIDTEGYNCMKATMPAMVIESQLAYAVLFMCASEIIPKITTFSQEEVDKLLLKYLEDNKVAMEALHSDSMSVLDVTLNYLKDNPEIMLKYTLMGTSRGKDCLLIANRIFEETSVPANKKLLQKYLKQNNKGGCGENRKFKFGKSRTILVYTAYLNGLFEDEGEDENESDSSSENGENGEDHEDNNGAQTYVEEDSEDGETDDERHENDGEDERDEENNEECDSDVSIDYNDDHMTTEENRNKRKLPEQVQRERTPTTKRKRRAPNKMDL